MRIDIQTATAGKDTSERAKKKASSPSLERDGDLVQLGLNDGKLLLTMTAHEFKSLIQEVEFSVHVMLSHSLWAKRRIYRLRQGARAFLDAMNAQGFMTDGLWSVTAHDLDQFDDASASQLMVNWLHASTSFGNSINDYMDELLKKKIITALPVAQKLVSWRIDHSDFRRMTDDDVNAGSGSEWFRITNHSSLRGFTQPAYFHSGEIDILIKNGDLSFSVGGEDASFLLSHIDEFLLKQVNVAKKLWARCEMLESLFYGLLRSLKQKGLDDEGDYFDEPDAEAINTDLRRFFDALSSPRRVSVLNKEWLTAYPKKDTSITISFS